MTQLLHILKKDIRFMRYGLALYAGVLALYAFMELEKTSPYASIYVSVSSSVSYYRSISPSMEWHSVLVLLLATFLIPRVFHAEAIPGNNQFWLTRPYSRASLLGAKLMFVLVCLSLPLFVARLLTLKLQGFSVFPAIWQLLWSQLILTCVAALFVAALSALTSGMVQFVVTALVLIPVGYFVARDAEWLNPWPSSAMWFRLCLAACVLALVAAGSLYLLYRTRRLQIARGLTLGALVLCGVAYVVSPPSLGAAVNAWLAKPMSSTSSPLLSIGPRIELNPIPGSIVGVRLPVSLSLTTQGNIAALDHFVVTFRGSGKQEAVVLKFSQRGETTTSWSDTATGFMRWEFYRANAGKPVSLHVSADVFLYSMAVSREVQLSDKYVNIAADLICRENPPEISDVRFRFAGLSCLSPLNNPSQWISTRLYPNTGNVSGILHRNPSYSPLPGWPLSLLSVNAQHGSYSPDPSHSPTIYLQGKPRRFHRDYEFHDIPLERLIDIDGR